MARIFCYVSILIYIYIFQAVHRAVNVLNVSTCIKYLLSGIISYAMHVNTRKCYSIGQMKASLLRQFCISEFH